MVRSGATLIADVCPRVMALSFLLNENVNAGGPIIFCMICIQQTHIRARSHLPQPQHQ